MTVGPRLHRPRSDAAVGGVGPVEHYRVSGLSGLSGLSGNCRGVLDSARTWCLSRNILFAVGGCRATVGAVGCRGCRDCRAAVGIMSGVGVGVSGQGSAPPPARNPANVQLHPAAALHWTRASARMLECVARVREYNEQEGWARHGRRRPDGRAAHAHSMTPRCTTPTLDRPGGGHSPWTALT